MADFLREMAETSRERAEHARARRPGLVRQAEVARPPMPLVMDPRGFDLIAEAKLRSPIRGRLAPAGEDIATVIGLAEAYLRGGATAVSVLTEQSRFGGDLSHLAAVAGTVPIPVMRKDFLVHPVQVLEARAVGASGVLLIARILSEQRLVEMVDTALELGMFCVVEVFDEADLEHAGPVFEQEIVIGVNTRDLTKLTVDPGMLATLRPRLPAARIALAESGITGPEAARRVASLGYPLALVGTALVTAPDPEQSVADLVAAGRSSMAGGRR